MGMIKLINHQQDDLCIYCLNLIHYHERVEHFFKRRDCLCSECREKMKVIKQEILVNEVLIDSYYVYDEAMEKLLFQFKEGRDVALKIIFKDFVKYVLKKYRGYQLVILPSSEHKIRERGFIPLVEIFEGIPLINAFYKKRNYKQSQQKEGFRHLVKDVIALKDEYDFKNKKVLLIDDVCTSGESMKACVDLLHKQQAIVKCAVISMHQQHVKCKKRFTRKEKNNKI